MYAIVKQNCGWKFKKKLSSKYSVLELLVLLAYVARGPRAQVADLLFNEFWKILLSKDPTNITGVCTFKIT